MDRQRRIQKSNKIFRKTYCLCDEKSKCSELGVAKLKPILISNIKIRLLENESFIIQDCVMFISKRIFFLKLVSMKLQNINEVHTTYISLPNI